MVHIMIILLCLLFLLIDIAFVTLTEIFQGVGVLGITNTLLMEIKQCMPVLYMICIHYSRNRMAQRQKLSI